MDDIIDFKLVRFETLLIKFAKTNEIPHEFLDGSMNLDNLTKQYKHVLSEYHLKLTTKLKRLLSSRIKKSSENLYEAFMEDYLIFYNNQCTREDQWKYEIVSSKYRKNLNPIRALYYELLNIMNSYNPDSPTHML